jgi:amino acid transporter
MGKDIRKLMFGKAKDPLDPSIFHSLTLVAFFAWIGLGADGLSSSCYGPEEAFLSLGRHSHLSLILALMVMGTVFILSASYSHIIELFPSGGGGYVVASKLIGPIAGLISGCALLVDYILTIAISIASSIDAIFSFLPPQFLPWKFAATIACIVFLIILNLRGVKESIVILTPIFIIFVVTHIFIIFYGIFTHGTHLTGLVADTVADTHATISELGVIGMLTILFRAFCLGAGTFTGIEAVSNGVQFLREPRVATAKKTMLYMATSLSFTAGGLLIIYLLNRVTPVHGLTLNAVLIKQLTENWTLGHPFFLITMISEGALLAVAAQTGFLGGPRVMANMAADHWMPHRFTNLSERLVMEDGVLVMGLLAIGIIIYTHASVRILVVMYSINVFLTFTFSQYGMVRHWLETKGPGRISRLLVNGVSLVLTSAILVMMIVLKFMEGGWVTLALTGAFIALCIAIRAHYKSTILALRDLNQILGDLPALSSHRKPVKEPHAPTAVLIDSDRFKGPAELHALKRNCEQDLSRYVGLANSLGFYAESRASLGTDIIVTLEALCRSVSKEWEKKVYFMGQLAFEGETFWTRMLHNQTAFALQRKLLFSGLETVILPIRLRLEGGAAAPLQPAK